MKISKPLKFHLGELTAVPTTTVVSEIQPPTATTDTPAAANTETAATAVVASSSSSNSNNDNLSEDNTNQQDTTTKVIEARPLNTTNSWSKDIKFNFYDVSLLGIRNFLASPEQHSDSTDSGSGYHNIEAWDSFGNEIIDYIVTSEDLFLADISFNSNNGDF